MDNIEVLYDVCEVVSREMDEANDKLRQSGGKMTAGDLELIEKLSKVLKNIKTIIAMEEASEDGGSYAYDGSMSYERGGNRGGSTRGGSYARGRGGNPRRDSMGRYSSRGGYSRDGGDTVAHLERMMREARNEEQKDALREAIEMMRGA